MKNNPSQNVRTDYVANDVFVPKAANRLATSNPYDFVITQEQWDKFIEAHPNLTSVYLGNVIASDKDGQPVQFDTVKAPVSINIAANTGSMPLILDQRLIGNTSSGVIVDASDIGENDTAINIYSAYPYVVVSPVSRINLCNTLQTIVTFKTVQNGIGTSRVGVYTTGNSSIDYGTQSNGSRLIYQQCVGNGFTVTPYKAQVEDGNYVVPVVCADWLHGVTTGKYFGYSVDYATTSKPGLFQQIEESYANGTFVVINEINNGEVYPYVLEKFPDSSDITSEAIFSNSTTGKLMHVAYNGDISRENFKFNGNIVGLRDRADASVIKTLVDNTVNVFDMPDGVDYYAQIQEILGTGNSPAIEFKIDCILDHAIPTIAYLCQADSCGYMFTTDIAYLGHRYICVRYDNQSSVSSTLKVSISDAPIDIHNGDIEPNS